MRFSSWAAYEKLTDSGMEGEAANIIASTFLDIYQEYQEFPLKTLKTFDAGDVLDRLIIAGLEERQAHAFVDQLEELGKALQAERKHRVNREEAEKERDRRHEEAIKEKDREFKKAMKRLKRSERLLFGMLASINTASLILFVWSAFAG